MTDLSRYDGRKPEPPYRTQADAMEYLGKVRAALDDADTTPFGKIAKLLDAMAFDLDCAIEILRQVGA